MSTPTETNSETNDDEYEADAAQVGEEFDLVLEHEGHRDDDIGENHDCHANEKERATTAFLHQGNLDDNKLKYEYG